MTKPRTHDGTTEREMTDDELAAYQAAVAEAQKEADQIKAKEEAKIAAQTKLLNLGLTIQELEALGF